MSVKLGVNIDHIATLRQVRGGTTPYPDLVKMAQIAVSAGADQLTIHLREDRRHIQLHDVVKLTQLRPAPINLEMAANDEMLRIARKYKPNWACFVPEKRQELTTEGGLDVLKQMKKIAAMTSKLQPIGIQTSMFIEPSLKQVEASYKVGADAIELHTGKWVHLEGKKRKIEFNKLKEAAMYAHELGMRVHAGHGLDYNSTKEVLGLPYLCEVNIGHSLICYSVEFGLHKSIKKMKQILKK